MKIAAGRRQPSSTDGGPVPAGVAPAAVVDHSRLVLVLVVAGFAVFVAIATAVTAVASFLVAVSVGS